MPLSHRVQLAVRYDTIFLSPNGLALTFSASVYIRRRGHISCQVDVEKLKEVLGLPYVSKGGELAV
jgi:hypothetical protein